MPMDTHAATTADLKELREGVNGLRGDVKEMRESVNGLRGDVKEMRESVNRLRDEFKEFKDHLKDQFATKADLRTEVAVGINKVLFGVLAIAGLLFAALQLWPPS